MSQSMFRHKRIGYLAAEQCFTPETDVILLCTNLLKKELHAQNQYEIGPSRLTSSRLAASRFASSPLASHACCPRHRAGIIPAHAHTGHRPHWRRGWGKGRGAVEAVEVLVALRGRGRSSSVGSYAAAQKRRA